MREKFDDVAVAPHHEEVHDFQQILGELLALRTVGLPDFALELGVHVAALMAQREQPVHVVDPAHQEIKLVSRHSEQTRKDGQRLDDVVAVSDDFDL